MLLQDDAGGLIGVGWVVKDGGYADGVDGAAFGAGQALCGFPEALFAVRVTVGDGE